MSAKMIRGKEVKIHTSLHDNQEHQIHITLWFV